MRRFWFVLCLLAALGVGSRANAQSFNYTLDIDDAGAVNTGTGSSWSFSDDGSGLGFQLSGTTGLSDPVSDDLVWVHDLLLAMATWRWLAPAGPAPPQEADTITGSTDLDFGAAGQVNVQFEIYLNNSFGIMTVFVENFDPSQLSTPTEDFWVEARECYQGQSGSAQTGDGLLFVNGKQLASFSSTHSVWPIMDLSNEPALQMNAGVLVTVDPGQDGASFLGTGALGIGQSMAVLVALDEGGGPVLAAQGTAVLGPEPDAQHFQLDGELNTFSSQFDFVLPLMDLVWLNVWARLYSPPVPLAGLVPKTVTGSGTLDLGAVGSLGVDILIDPGQGAISVLLDVTQFDAINWVPPSYPYDLSLDESFVGVGGGQIDGTGTALVNGAPLASSNMSYALSPSYDTSLEPRVLLHTELTHAEIQSGPAVVQYGGRGRADLAQSTTVVWNFDLKGGGSVSASGSMGLTPTTGDNGEPVPDSFDLSGQLFLDGPLPARGLIMSQLPSIASWVRTQASLLRYPPAASGNSTSSIIVDFGLEGAGTLLHSFSLGQGFLSGNFDGSGVDDGLMELLPLDPCFLLQEMGTPAEEEGIEDNGCVTICEDDGQGGEICRSECAVRYAGDTKNLPKAGGNDPGDTNLPHYLRMFLCLDFLEGDTLLNLFGTVTFLAGPTGVMEIPAGGAIMMAPPYPNPTSSSTVFSLRLAAAAPLRVQVFDVRGRLVRTIVDGPHGPGEHRLDWDGRDAQGRGVASGAYWVRMSSGSEVATRKLLLLR